MSRVGPHPFSAPRSIWSALLVTTFAPSLSRNKAQGRMSVCAVWWWCHVRTCTQTSRLIFVDMPGSERLAMDPEVLLLREGVLLNKSLLDFSRGERWLSIASRLYPMLHGVYHHAVQSSSTGLCWQHWHETGADDEWRCLSVPCCAVLCSAEAAGAGG